MNYFIKIILPIYFIIYFGIAFVLKSLIVAKRIGKNPLVLPKDDSAYGLIGLYFKLTLIAMFVYVLAFAFFPTWHGYFLQIKQLENVVFAVSLHVSSSHHFDGLLWFNHPAGLAFHRRGWRVTDRCDSSAMSSSFFSSSPSTFFFLQNYFVDYSHWCHLRIAGVPKFLQFNRRLFNNWQICVRSQLQFVAR